jgi:ABC-type taurine transport system ATPase subunit
MLTRLAVRNFKLYDEVEIELGQRVVLVGPNNAGKTTALQALALWSAGVRRWVDKRGSGNVPRERAGVTLNRRDLIALPVPSANLLWRGLHVREGVKEGGKSRTKNVLIDIEVDGVSSGAPWRTALEFDYANEESFYCRSKLGPDGKRRDVPEAAVATSIAYLPPMSGLASNELRLDEGAIAVRLGEGRTAEVLRNLCWRVAGDSGREADWARIVEQMKALFGIELDRPVYLPERGEVTMTYRQGGVRLDLSASGRGQQQTLLLLAYMASKPGAVLLLDEPDAHLEILRQRQIYQVLTQTAERTGSQIIAASHSEVILNEAADRDIVVAFVGKPHRIDDRGGQVLKALKEIGFEHYLQAEQTGWVLFLEGATDLAILKAFAESLRHPARAALERAYVHYVGNQPQRARDHFHGLKEAKPDLVGIGIYDRLPRTPPSDDRLTQLTWRRREIECYLCSREVLLAHARRTYDDGSGPLFARRAEDAMARAIDEVERALQTLGKPDPWSEDCKVSDDFLDPVFRAFFQSMGLPEGTMRKTDYHTLAPLVARTDLDPEVVEKLDAIAGVAARARRACAEASA